MNQDMQFFQRIEQVKKENDENVQFQLLEDSFLELAKLTYAQMLNGYRKENEKCNEFLFICS